MVNDPTLLVVDDEHLYCEACRRIFSQQGFRVDEADDAGRGLCLARQNDYAAILLDVKMPTMDGIEFLQQLRNDKPDVPVILMTGFPSVPNAASAVRLKASDYVTKPFTPEEITQAVRKLLGEQRSDHDAPSIGTGESWEPRSAEFRFLGESWLQWGNNGTVRAGALLPKSEVKGFDSVRMPRIGEIVYQGLPLAALLAEGRPLRSIPSPVSGVVVAVNSALAASPGLLSATPLDAAWIACIAPTRSEEQFESCRPRSVILANADEAGAAEQQKRLAAVGCSVRVASNWGEIAPMLSENGCTVVVLDEVSFGSDGPAIVERIRAKAPAVKLLVLASPDSRSETAYRERKIFYYAVEPFADDEIVDILHAAFRPEAPPAANRPAREIVSDPVRSIHITNRNGHRVCLLTPNGVVRTAAGFGLSLRQKLLDARLPVETYLGDDPLSPADVLKAAKTADRVFIMLLKDVGRTPGCLVRGGKGEFDWASGDTAEKVTALVIQPDEAGSMDGLAPATTDALAARIIDELASA